jgi:DNA-binding FrmR family transcriptional regulator
MLQVEAVERMLQVAAVERVLQVAAVERMLQNLEHCGKWRASGWPFAY